MHEVNALGKAFPAAGLNCNRLPCYTKRDIAEETVIKYNEIKQIAGAVQNNSAMAEETSATREELSAQAVTLNELVGKFELRRD